MQGEQGGTYPKVVGSRSFLSTPAHCVNLGKKQEKKTREDRRKAGGVNTRATTNERDGRGRGRGWVAGNRGTEKAERKHPDVHMIQPTWPKCGQREREGKGGEEVQEEKQKRQEEEKGDPKGKEGRDSGGSTICSLGPQPGLCCCCRLSCVHARQLVVQDPPPGRPALRSPPCHRPATTQAQLGP